MKKVFLVGDSYGVPRHHGEGSLSNVLEESTWPCLVGERLQGGLGDCTVKSDFLAFRMLEEVPALVERQVLEHQGLDCIVVQAGIVDCFPRPLPKKIFRDRRYFFKVIRKLLSPALVRHLWMKWVFAGSMSSISEFKGYMADICRASPSGLVYFVNIPENIHPEALATIGANQRIGLYNDVMKDFCGSVENAVYLDVYSAENLEELLSDIDSHPTKLGHSVIASKVIDHVSG